MVEKDIMYVHHRTKLILKALCKYYVKKTVANCLDDIISDFIDAYEINVDELLGKVQELEKQLEMKQLERSKRESRRVRI